MITHLEKVILVHNTAVGQSLHQFICQSGFSTIGHSVKSNQTIPVNYNDYVNNCWYYDQTTKVFLNPRLKELCYIWFINFGKTCEINAITSWQLPKLQFMD